MRYLIIGLGIYGTNLATNLTDMGHEVIGADADASRVEAIKNLISTAYIVDATDQSALDALPLSTVDLVIVAIGENFGASIRIVALLKQLKVKHIYARAIDPLHHSILESFNIDRILTPEQRAAGDLAAEMALGSHVDSLALTQSDFILKFTAPARYIGMPYTSLPLTREFGLTLIGATRTETTRNLLGIAHETPKMITPLDGATVEEGDTFICQGTSKAYKSLCSSLS